MGKSALRVAGHCRSGDADKISKVAKERMLVGEANLLIHLEARAPWPKTDEREGQNRVCISCYLNIQTSNRRE